MLQPTYDNLFLWHNYAIITLYILEWPSSWSTSRIRHSWPQCRVRLRLLLLSSKSILLVCFGPPSILLFTPTTHVSRSTLPCQLSSLTPMYVQVNNMATLCHIYTVTYIYITFILLSTPFFILLPLFWAGRLVHLHVCHRYNSYEFPKLVVS
jgi:hypothetical protein